jgi:DNA-binding NarL/FixJ family response regulator
MPKIWIIEDNVAYRDATLRGLRSSTPSNLSLAFSNCEDAIAQIDLGDYPDVILMDIGLPGMDGIDGIGLIKQRIPRTAIMILTVFEDDNKIFRAIKAGASGYLLKSDTISNVCDSIQLVMEGAAPIHPRVASRILAMFSELAPAKTDYGLNERETAVLDCMARGLVRKQTATQMKLNIHTIDYIMRCIYKKLHVNGATAAVAFAIREHLIESYPEVG